MKNVLTLFAFLLFITGSFAQSVGINEDGSQPDSKAQLDLKSSTKGFLPPRLTYENRNAMINPPAGLIIWCSNCGANGEIQVYNGTVWTNFTGGPASTFVCGKPIMDSRDGKSYPTVLIGNQCWMAGNLNYGTLITSSSHQRDNCINEKYCYQDLSANCAVRGANYQWDELMRYDDTPGLQGLCPPAWHVPTEVEWNTLFAFYTNNGFAGSPLKYSGYSGFNALLGGVSHLNRQWDFNGFATFFWSSTAHGPNKAWSHGMNDYNPSVSFYPSSTANAFSVRCIKDN